MKGQFNNRNDKLQAEQAILKSHLLEHKKHLQTLCLGPDERSNKIKSNYGQTFYKLCIVNTISALRKEYKLQLRCKNLELFRLIPRKKDSRYQVSVLNLLTENINTTPLRHGLHQSFTDKNKYVKINVSVEFETLTGFLDPHFTHREKESFHKYLRSATNIIAKNVYSDVDKTYKSFSNLINNKNIVILAADKETCAVILNRTDYQNNVNNMINEGIAAAKYIQTVDNTHKDLKCFQDFIYRNLYKHEQYENMRPKSNQPGRFFATAKTHKFDSVNDITLDKLKLRPIIDQTGTYISNASKVVAKYLRPLYKNKYTIDDTLTFPDLLKNAEESDD